MWTGELKDQATFARQDGDLDEVAESHEGLAETLSNMHMQDKLDLEDDLKHERRRLNSFQKAQVVEGKRPLGLDIPGVEEKDRAVYCNEEVVWERTSLDL